MYISIVESIPTADEIERVRGFLGPIMRLSGRSEMKLSGNTVYGILTRSIVTVKKNEAWFHFAGQPMKFSIREFHMVTGLKCNGEVEGPRGEYEWDLLKGRTHKLSDVLNQLKKTRVDASDERVFLAILLPVESILLSKNNKGTFPLEYVNKAKDMMYPWGLDAYLVLLSNWAPTVDVSGPIYLCEKYTELENPSLERVLQIEAHKKLKVTCILPPIPNDPEDDVSMEDEHSDELESVKDISKKGYKFKADDWKNRSVDTLDRLDALIHMTIHMTKNVETSQASASIEDDSENTKLNKIIELMTENAKSMKDRIGTPLSPMYQQPETPSLQTQEFSHNLPLENDPERSYETPSNANEKENLSDEDATEPATVIIETQDFTPVLTQQVRTEATNETPVSPISPQSIETPMVTKGMYDSTEALTEIISATNKKSLTEIISATNKQVGTEATNETPFSPIAPQSIETPFFTLIQTQQEDTLAVHNTPSSLVSSLISRVIEETLHLQTSASPPLSTLFENGADVEIATSDDATCRIWYPGNHVDAAFAMLNQKRIEQFSWFSEQGIPKACFVPVQFLETVGYSYENLQKPDRKGINILKGWVGEVVRGLIHPNKMWMQDVDIVYGVVHERLVDHFIGGGDTSDGEHNHNLSLWRSQGLIPAINLEMMNEEINFNDIIPFQVKKAEGLPKTKLPFNCGLFVVKTLE
uniref:DUF1985 domain-containing protein n=1 Tax=Brassica oleracea var. oleracea TaxID=109376 RepID=A0A0D3E5S0_BRAOL